MLKRKKSISHHVDKKLRFRFWVFLLIAIVMVGVIAYDIFLSILSPLYALLGILVGLAIGIISARMFRVTYDRDVKKVIAKLDIVGGMILVVYILIAIFRTKLVGAVVHGPQVAPVGIAIITGSMIGRVIGLREQILKALKSEGIL